VRATKPVLGAGTRIKMPAFSLAMATRKRISFSEEQAALLWRHVVGRELACTEQQPIHVIYPGRANGDKGPDFRDAVIRQGSHLSKGDVEVHVSSGDWYSHGHHHDAEYNDVILHVVMWHDCAAVTLLHSGRSVPVLCLTQALRHQAYLLPYHLPCHRILTRLDRQDLAALLDSAGDRRFRHKAQRFLDGIARLATEDNVGHALFRGMMRALGYAKNTRPFEDLADRMNLRSVSYAKGLPLKQALLLGTAGLLPSQRWPGEVLPEPEAQELERVWRSIGRGVRTMGKENWSLTGIYPNNSPVRRIIAQSHLLERYCSDGLLAAVMRLVREASVSGGHELLDDGLTVNGNAYWRDHFDFGLRNRTQASALLGKSKARELAVNVALPFAYSWGRLSGETELADRAIELYRGYPRLADNYLTRHMIRQLGLDQSAGLTACHQQGLIHIFSSYCREGKCSVCPLVS
jgi:hypothetical protein